MHFQRTSALVALVVVSSALLLWPLVSHAGTIDFTLTQASLSGAPGDTLVFDGTLTNTGSTTVFLNGDSFTTQTSFLVLDDSAFFANTPASLAPSGTMGDSVGPVDLFSVFIQPGAAPGVYLLNFFNVQGGADNIAQDVLATEQFTVTVTSTPAPEPGVLLLLGAGIAVMLLFRRPGQ